MSILPILKRTKRTTQLRYLVWIKKLKKLGMAKNFFLGMALVTN